MGTALFIEKTSFSLLPLAFLLKTQGAHVHGFLCEQCLGFLWFLVCPCVSTTQAQLQQSYSQESVSLVQFPKLFRLL
jgi:hypothetical protein